MGFSNTTIKPPRTSKPHICFRDGWWRVSTLSRTARFLYPERWTAAHALAGRLNHARRS